LRVIAGAIDVSYEQDFAVYECLPDKTPRRAPHMLMQVPA